MNATSSIVVVAGNDHSNVPDLLVGQGGGSLDEYLNGLEVNGGYRVVSVSAIDPQHILVTVREDEHPNDVE